MAKEITQEMRDALTAAQEAQTAFWDAMNTLESETGIADIDGQRELSQMSVEDLFDDEEEEQDDDECTCDDRSWYGPDHDSACPLEGQRKGFDASIGGVKHGQ